MINISERLEENVQKVKVIHAQLQQLQQTSQDLLQELLKLAGEARLLNELQKEEARLPK